MPRWPPPVYHIELEFDAPRDFAFAWCTDYRADDATRSKESFERRLLSRSPRRVVFEDLGWSAQGWVWRHTEVALHPPGRWHGTSFGSFRTGEADYTLAPIAPDRCRFSLTFWRRPSPIHPEQPSERTMQAELTRMWTNYGRALARDYRASRGRRGARR